MPPVYALPAASARPMTASDAEREGLRMDVGVGLPTGLPHAHPQEVLDWARRADAGPFASVGVIDRFVYPSYEPLVALSAAAAVTERVQLVTCILIAPLREIGSLAKQVVSLDALSGGRLTLGVAIGARDDDYDTSEFAGRPRGDRLTEQLTQLHAVFESGAMVPSAAQRKRPPILVGGLTDAAFRRMACFSDGYIYNGGPPRLFAKVAKKAREAWADANRLGRPQLWAQSYFALGDAASAGRDYLLDYYAFTGDFAKRIADGLLTTAEQVHEHVQGYSDAGCDHLVMFPAVADPAQVDRLAKALNAP